MLSPDRLLQLLDALDAAPKNPDQSLEDLVLQACDSLKFSFDERGEALAVMTTDDAPLPSLKNFSKLDFRAPNRCSVELPGGGYYTREWEKGEKKLYERRNMKRVG